MGPIESRTSNASRPSHRTMPSPVDFVALYDDHPEYVARRRAGSLEEAQIDIEVRLFKLPNLLRLLDGSEALASVLEIGCATGELIAAVPVRRGGRRVGIDIAPTNVAAARARHPDVEFHCGDFRMLEASPFDAVILSDVLEHVPDDEIFLRDAAAFGRVVLLNLPLENNWLNMRRRYGPEDVSGHLRRYSLADGLALVSRAGLEVIACEQVWIHETTAEQARRSLRRERLGAAFAGAWPARSLRRLLYGVAGALPPVGRRLFASNLFVAAHARGMAPAAAHARPLR